MKRSEGRPGAGRDLRSWGVPVAIVLLAAAIRFATLGTQSYEADEAVTVHLLHLHFGTMLRALPGSESTPPLYYVIAWGWARVFGFGEAGVRSLSALFGTLLVAVAFVLGDRWFSRRAAIAVGLLAAVNPLLVWFSQEARAYMLLVLLTAVSLGLFMAAIARPGRPLLAGWALTSAAAIATHYFAVFPVAVEAVWLLHAPARRRGAVSWAVAFVVACAAALAPLALHQKGHAAYKALLAATGSLPVRILQIPKQFVLGYSGPAELVLGILGVALAVTCLLLWWVRTPAVDRVRQLPFASVAAISVLVPALLALVGLDFLITRNVIVAWVPSALLVAAGATVASRGARLLGAALAVLSAAVLAVDLSTPAYQRDDWRGGAHALGGAPVARALVLTGPSATPMAPGSPPPVPLSLYLSGVTAIPASGALVDEVDYLALAKHARLSTRSVARSLATAVPARWQEIAHTDGSRFTVIRFRLGRPLLVRPGVPRGLGGQPGQLLVVRPNA